MNVVHTFFRREVRLAAGLVRRVEPGDTARSAIVGQHLDLVGRALHHHHVTEDEMLWPLLLDRAPDQVAPLVHLMQTQHARVHDLLERIAPLLTYWTTSADAASRDRLARLYDELSVGLVEHLDDEESRLLPVAAASLTEAEWNGLGEAGRAGSPRSERSLMFGMMAYEGDPEVVTAMLASAPFPVRVLVPRLGRRAFRKHALAVHGTATP